MLTVYNNKEEDYTKMVCEHQNFRSSGSSKMQYAWISPDIHRLKTHEAYFWSSAGQSLRSIGLSINICLNSSTINQSIIQTLVAEESELRNSTKMLYHSSLSVLHKMNKKGEGVTWTYR